MKRVFTALTLILGLHLAGSSGDAHAEQRFVLMTPKAVQGVGANCLIPDSFYLSFTRNDNGTVKLGRQRARPVRRNAATFTRTTAQAKVGRVITTRIRGERVVLTELAANLSDKSSCTYTFHSKKIL